MMHALGKFLYNKRLPPGSSEPAATQLANQHHLPSSLFSQQMLQSSWIAQQPCSSHLPPGPTPPSIGHIESHRAGSIAGSHPSAAPISLGAQTDSQPSQQSQQSSKQVPEAAGSCREAPGSWPAEEGALAGDDDFVDLTLDDALSQQLDAAAGASGGDAAPCADPALLPMASR